MNSPWLSSSFRDFWSYRWNLPMKANMHRLGFVPFVKVSRWFFGIKDGERTPKLLKLFGVFGKLAFYNFKEHS